jgi:hypothetical protein
MAAAKPVWCSRVVPSEGALTRERCGRKATRERWDPRGGCYLPVCDAHAQDATPFELRPLPPP